MPFDFSSDALRLAVFEGLTLDWLELTLNVMIRHLEIVEYFATPHHIVSALKLHFV
jgi:hypothetical protein